MITVVMTSCGRPELLKRTLNSFYKFNTLPAKEFIIVEDSGKEEMVNIIHSEHPEIKVLFNEERLGQIRSIDKGYAEVKTPYLFHVEDDWDFYKSGFMEKSLTILENDKKIMQVWLRELYDTNTHPIEDGVFYIGKVSYRMVKANALGGVWHGFTWNPGLRRLADYKLLAPFSSLVEAGDFNALTECHIGQKYYDNYKFRACILTEGYVRHIGYGEKAK